MLRSILKRLIPLILFATLAGGSARAQWTLANVPYGGYYTSFANLHITAFVGTNGDGAYRSTDSGKTWTRVDSGLTNTNIKSVASLGNYLFAGTGDGVFRSSDDGKNWAPADSGLPLNLKPVIFSLEVFGSNLFAGTQEHSNYAEEVFLSSDSGANWSSAN